MNLSPLPIQKFFASNGQPLAGGLLFTYAGGTSNKLATYVDSGTTANTNPIVLDSRGECRLWIDPQRAYKFVLAPAGDSDPPASPIWSVDDITAAPTYPRSAAEVAAEAIIVDWSYPPGNVLRYGNNSEPGATPMHDAIQMAIKVVSQQNANETLIPGGVVVIPPGKYLINETIQAASYITIQGQYGETDFVPGHTRDSGTILIWGGDTSGTMLSVFNVRMFKLSGVTLDGQLASGVTGILLDSTNNPSGSQNEFSQFNVHNCLVGVQWGTSGTNPGYANDGTRFSTFTIWSNVPNSKGFVVNSGNAGQMSVIESGGIQVQALGIDLQVCNLLQIRRVFGGGVMALGFIQASVAIDVLIEGCSSECWGAGRTWRSNGTYFLHVVAPVEPHDMLQTPITMANNQINNPILIESTCRIVSTGDAWGQCKDYNTGADVPAIGTATAGPAYVLALNNGIHPFVVAGGSNVPAWGWIGSNQLKLTALDPYREWIAPNFQASNYTGSGAMSWVVAASNQETLAYKLSSKTMTVAFTINASSVGGNPNAALIITIPAGQVSAKSMTNSCLIFEPGYAGIGFCSVGASGTSIVIQKPDLSNFVANTSNTTVRGQITFEVV
jgi:hypothetical protein